jgi:hypothetical protein
MTALARTGGEGRQVWAVNADRKMLSGRLKIGYGVVGLGRRR